MDYKDIKCPVCERFFKDGDDIVVCPKCGAPYHRGCYESTGKCIFDELHESGKAWEAPVQEAPKAPDAENEPKTNICPRCGEKNAESALFCNKCGYSLSGTPKTYNNSEYLKDEGNAPFPGNGSPGGVPGGFYAPGMPFGAFVIDTMGGYKKQEPVADGVSAGELSEIVKTNQPYYMTAFHNKQYFGKNKFNFCSFLFSGAWLLYRKVNKLGIWLTSLMALIMIADTYLSYFVISPLMLSTLSSMGIDVSSGVGYSDIYNMTSHLLQTDPTKALLMCIPTFIGIIKLIIMIICGINGNRWYFNSCVKKIRAVKEKTSSESPEFHETLSREGGVNTAVGICLLVCYSIITYIPQFFL